MLIQKVMKCESFLTNKCESLYLKQKSRPRFADLLQPYSRLVGWRVLQTATLTLVGMDLDTLPV